MPKGGYRVINLNGTNLSTGVDASVPGLYSSIEGTNGKPLLFTNFKFGGVEQNAAWVTLKAVGNGYQGIWAGQRDGYLYFMRVSQDDKIQLSSVQAVQPAGDEPVSGQDGPSASM